MGVVRRFVGALLLSLIVVTTVGFATGRISSVVTNGTSMLPSHEAGDLVVVARVDRYGVGDVAAYREPDSGEIVLHRIVGGDASAFEMRGDNNTSTDVTAPSAGDLIGRQVLHLPSVGRWIGSPLVMAVIAGLLIGLSSLLTLRGGTERPHEVTAASEEPGRAARAGRRWRWWHGVLISLDVAAVAGLLAAIVSPPAIIDPPPEPMHVGALSYAAVVVPDETYPDGRVDTGDTVFLRLVDRVDVSFVYEGDPSLSAAARLRMSVGSTQGWGTARALAPLTPVTAGGATLRGTLDLGQIREMLNRVSESTGIPLTNVEVRVEAIVEMETDDPSVTTSVTEMVFRFDDIVLDLADSNVVTPSPSGPVVLASAPIRDVVEEPTEVGGVPREARRWLVVALLVLVAATATSWPTGDQGAHRTGHHRSRRSRSGTIGRAREVADPVPVTLVADVELPDDRMRVRLATRADLVQMAREADAPLLVRDDGWCALVSDRAVHWWAPDTGPGVGPIEAVTIAPSVAPQMRTLADVWAVEPPRFAPDHELAPHELPTTEIRIDAVEQLRDEMLAPRRPLFADRPPAPLPAPAVPLAAPAPPPAVPSAPTAGRDDPLRTTIDEIVAYLSEVAPRPQGDARDLAS